MIKFLKWLLWPFRWLLRPFLSIWSDVAFWVFVLCLIGIFVRPTLSLSELLPGWQDRLRIRFVFGCGCLFGVYLYLVQEPNTGEEPESRLGDRLLWRIRRFLKGLQQEREPVIDRVAGEDLPRSELYRAAIQMTIHSDTISWTRMNTFLTSSSILMVAWGAALYQLKQPAIAIFIACMGLLLSMAWAPFSSRNRRLHTRYGDIARGLERVSVRPRLGPLAADQIKHLLLEDIFRTQRLVVLLPLFFAAGFWGFLLKSIQLWLTTMVVSKPPTPAWEWPVPF